ncbi:hypothetical protein C8T65DRAFT_518639, partial [Cerioporus squamosus]
RKPSTDQLNHFLRPLVDELLVFWRTGVFYSRTAKYPDGRLVRCALGPLVCDLPAARQTSGFGGYMSKYFCSVCKLLREDINTIDPENWPPRSCEEHRAAAAAWKDKPSVAQRKDAFKENSIRWSALLDLPYWDPVQFTVIDSMHNHYLGLLKHHCRRIWGMNVAGEDADDDESVLADLSPSQVAEGLSRLYSGTSSQLERFILGRHTLKHIHANLRNIELPSWVNAVPANVGTKARGKLSADQWHVFCVICLPIILIRLWHKKGDHQQEILDNYMDLVTEVVIGSLLQMSEEAIKLYETVSVRYLRGLQKLYPGTQITPNQHNSVHIAFFLRLYGPLHSIRTFFSERMNYLLQRVNTNMKFG